MKHSDRFVWPVRIASMLVASVSGLTLTRALYPLWHEKPVNPLAAGLSAFVCLIWGLTLLAPGLLGWLPNEDAPKGRDVLTGWQRVGILFGGVLAVALTGAFLTAVGESNPDP